MKIETRRLVLRNFKEEDINDYFTIVSQKNVGPRCGWEPCTDKNVAMDKLMEDTTKQYKFAIELKDCNEVIGCVEILDLVNLDKYPFVKESDMKDVKEVGFFINEYYWNKGYMTEALDVIIATCFEVLGYKAVVASYYEPNVASGKVQSKCGMKCVGKLKDYTTWYETNEPCDLVMMQILAEDYNKNKTNKEIEISE